MAVTRHGCLRLASRAPGLAAGLRPGCCVSRLRSALSLTSLPAAQTRRNMSPSLPPTDPRVVFSCGAIYEDAAGNAGVQAPGARARVSGTAGRRAGRPRGRGWFSELAILVSSLDAAWSNILGWVRTNRPRVWSEFISWGRWTALEEGYRSPETRRSPLPLGPAPALGWPPGGGHLAPSRLTRPSVLSRSLETSLASYRFS